jgi:hypothetical protein
VLCEIDSRKWVRANGLLVSIGVVQLHFVEAKERPGLKNSLRVTAARNGEITAEITTTDVGSLWLPGRLRKGFQLVASSGTVTLRRNGPRPMKRHRRIDVSGGDISWTMSGAPGVVCLRDQSSGALMWVRATGAEVVNPEMSDVGMCVLGTLLYGHVSAALCAIPSLSR